MSKMSVTDGGERFLQNLITGQSERVNNAIDDDNGEKAWLKMMGVHFRPS